jgi:hypothetical protein
MNYGIRQLRIAARALHYESDICEQCWGTERLGGSLRPCICTGGKLYYPRRVETGSKERAFGFGKTDEQLIDLWVHQPLWKKGE